MSTERESFNPEYDAAMEAASVAAGHEVVDRNEALYELNSARDSFVRKLVDINAKTAVESHKGSGGLIIPRAEQVSLNRSELVELLDKDIKAIDKHIKALGG